MLNRRLTWPRANRPPRELRPAAALCRHRGALGTLTGRCRLAFNQNILIAFVACERLINSSHRARPSPTGSARAKRASARRTDRQLHRFALVVMGALAPSQPIAPIGPTEHTYLSSRCPGCGSGTCRTCCPARGRPGRRCCWRASLALARSEDPWPPCRLPAGALKLTSSGLHARLVSCWHASSGWQASFSATSSPALTI